MGHRLDKRVFSVEPVRELFSETEHHEQRIVDRDTKPDESDQELYDDRHIGQVGQPVDAQECRENRRHRNE